jgi:UDP-N-acetylglucosamine 2-epimerase (non-hydrolysing)
VMADICFRMRDDVVGDAPPLPQLADASGGYLVATIHRAENTDDPDRLDDIVATLAALTRPVALFAHPRLVARAKSFGISLDKGAIHRLPPLSYRDMISAILSSRGVVTDSGGLQKEAFLLGVPCTTLRSETEWPETLADGWNILDPKLTKTRLLADRPAPAEPRARPYGDGHAAKKIVETLALWPSSISTFSARFSASAPTAFDRLEDRLG